MSQGQPRTRPIFWLMLFGVAGDLSGPLFPSGTFIGTPLLVGLLSGIIFIIALHLFRLARARQTSGTPQVNGTQYDE